MIRYSDLTPLGRTVVATLATLALLLLMGVAGAIETSGAATNDECDAMYHAVWAVQDEPSHSTLVDIATSLDCPFSE